MNAEKEKALHLSKAFVEQNNIDQGESEDESTAQPKHQDLAGVKILHGLDKVMEGGAVVLTLKDQSILADGDINQEVDMLENVEIGEQKQTDEAYKAAKKKTGKPIGQLIIICGRNKLLVSTLESLEGKIPVNIRGFETQMQKWMGATTKGQISKTIETQS
ncbi:hypothetical protein RJ640_018184 [Escallonia rubra]|uniref:Uncharacterized protein n=1 Tax=Escallonia rubra TaxID=112253 RepID=A0AA88QWG3_9ASTE|nr:hypothetical protein RJ640_018184 [Escallonia rubra]